MPLRFPRPVRRAGSSFIYFRQRIPADIRVQSDIAAVEVASGDFRTQVRLTPRTRCIKLSLQTRDPALAQERQALIIGRLQAAWRTLRAGKMIAERNIDVSSRAAAFSTESSSASRVSSQPAGLSSGEPGIRLEELFERWAREARPSVGTESDWRAIVRNFAEFLGQKDLRSITQEDVRRWKDHLVARGLKAKTVNDAKLAALRAICSWGCENGHLDSNPVKDVRVRVRLRAGDRMLGFSENEASAILSAARGQRSPVYKWLPLLCAMTGARVAEIGQLRKEDVRCEEGIWFLDICSAAGPLKGPGSERRVPLHPCVIEGGFLTFVSHSPDGPLFFNAQRRSATARKPPGKIVGKNVASWVRRLDLGIGRSMRKDPNHAWRHRFKTLAREAGVPDSVSDRITGHAAASEGQNYGCATLRTLFAEISKIPVPILSDQSLRFDPADRSSAGSSGTCNSVSGSPP